MFFETEPVTFVPRSADGGRKAPGRVYDSEPVTFQDLRDPGGRVDLLEGGFGVGVDPMRQVDDLVARGLDRRGNASLGVFEGGGGSGGGQRGHSVSS